MKNDKIPLQIKILKILFRYRATPLKDGTSPAERYLNRKLRIRLDKLKPYVEKTSILKQPGTRSSKVGDLVNIRIY